MDELAKLMEPLIGAKDTCRAAVLSTGQPLLNLNESMAAENNPLRF